MRFPMPVTSVAAGAACELPVVLWRHGIAMPDAALYIMTPSDPVDRIEVVATRDHLLSATSVDTLTDPAPDGVTCSGRRATGCM